MLIDTSTVTEKGQVTIPLLIRKKLFLTPGDRVSFLLEEEKVKLMKTPNFFSLRGSLKTTKKYNKKKAREAIGKMLAKKYGHIS